MSHAILSDKEIVVLADDPDQVMNSDDEDGSSSIKVTVKQKIMYNGAVLILHVSLIIFNWKAWWHSYREHNKLDSVSKVANCLWKIIIFIVKNYNKLELFKVFYKLSQPHSGFEM